MFFRRPTAGTNIRCSKAKNISAIWTWSISYGRLPHECGRSVAQLVINWTIHQPGITSALVRRQAAGPDPRKRRGAGWQLTAEQAARIEAALAARGKAARRMPV